ncbi:MAG TPA: L,D-transpeptidase [Gaiellaceae bacterium]|nr:L,D-transpeptidase [Gaiellaceae bacterium]
MPAAVWTGAGGAVRGSSAGPALVEPAQGLALLLRAHTAMSAPRDRSGALHGLENIGGVLGTAVSPGCVRLSDGAMRWLVARIGPGAPATITG